MIRGTELFLWSTFDCQYLFHDLFWNWLRIWKVCEGRDFPERYVIGFVIVQSIWWWPSEILALTWVWRSLAPRRPSSRRPEGRYVGWCELHTSLLPVPARRSDNRQWKRVRRPGSKRFRDHQLISENALTCLRFVWYSLTLDDLWTWQSTGRAEISHGDDYDDDSVMGCNAYILEELLPTSSVLKIEAEDSA
jgi:hypothetical protein